MRRRELFCVVMGMCLLSRNGFAGCWNVPATLFHAAELPNLVQGEQFSFSGSGPVLGFFLQEQDGRTRMLRAQKGKVDQLFLAPPAGQAFRSPRWTLWDGGEVAVVDDERFFAVYVGAALAFYEEKRYRSEVHPAFRGGEVFWSPHTFDLCKARKSDVVRGAYLSSGGEHEVWSVPDMNWDASLPEKTDKLDERRAFAIPSKNGVWVVEPIGGNVYYLRGGKPRRVYSAQSHKWTKWSEEGEAKEEFAKKLQEVRETTVAEAETLLLQDATRPQRKKLFADVKLREPYFREGFARGDQLLLQLHVAKPEKALLWLGPGEEAVCLSFAMLFERPANWKEDIQSWFGTVAVTDEAIWFKNPFGFVAFEELTRWLAEQQDKAQRRGEE